ncbi:Dolichyl-diphosphooligosaccharide--protein glycosyltransferase subunit 2 [Frankliniella fusca]|uniref:Dolichyl-diphosphooligosaccharide--protein glycosyltransferase subunit 2 n=1 Tax=Frankliniella fusca TaxID=407009 RepID=A0AAE1LKN5_9NEOP|nr:Dolichyl-diphosphooligosaccharide--protein glycosyltransferase subunit 2 [Frankliniella fusca]
MKGLILFLCLALTRVSLALPATSSYLSDSDRSRLRQVLDGAWDVTDLPTIHYGALGYKLLGQALPKPQEVCKFLGTKTSETSSEALFHLTNAWKAIGTCGSLPSTVVAKRLNEITSSDASSLADLYYAVLGLKALGQRPSDTPKVLKNIQSALKKDDSALSLGYAFHVAAATGADGRVIFDRIQDAIAQADEVDGRFLQFEGGLSITALVVSGTFNLATSQNKAPPMTHEQTTKFANYFLSRRSVQTAKGIYSLLDVLNILSSNKFILPVAVSLEGTSAVSSSNPKVLLKVSDVLGKPISTSAISVIAESAKGSEDVVILSKKKFEPTQDKTVFALNVFEEKPAPGQYSLTVSATLNQADSRIPSNIVTTLTIKAMCAVTITSFEIGTADADQTTQPKMHKVTYPSKLPSVLEADSQQKIVVRFQLVAAGTNKPLIVHQAFLRLWNEKSKQEIIFNAERDSSKVYKFDMDVGAKDPDFGFLSGEFHVDLIVGDAIIVNPLMWHVADLKLSPPSSETKEHSVSNHAYLYKPKPEIKHMFREPEKRPAAVVSNLFTALVCLPLLILLSLWAKLGINISNFPVSLSAVGFHLGLTSIFGLFVVFWLELNMFTTVKYLIGLGAITFLSGNKMLAQIAARPKA